MMFLPLTASTTSEVENDHAHVIMQDICNKFIAIKISVGCMVWGYSRPKLSTPNDSKSSIDKQQMKPYPTS